MGAFAASGWLADRAIHLTVVFENLATGALPAAAD